MPAVRATTARYLFCRCPTSGPWVPIWRAGTDRLMVSNRTPYVLLFLILLVNLFSYSYFVFTFFISWKNRHFQFYKTEIVDTSFLAFQIDSKPNFMILLPDLWYFNDTSCKIIRKVSFVYIAEYQLLIRIFHKIMILWYFFSKKTFYAGINMVETLCHILMRFYVESRRLRRWRRFLFTFLPFYF